MSRLFIENIKERIENLKKNHISGSEFSIVTGKLGYKLITEYITPLIKEHLPQIRMGILCVPNNLFGETVTVSGLISGRDIIETVKHSKNVSGRIVLPPNSLNHDGVMIDNILPSELRDELHKEILVPEDNFLEDSIITV